MCVVLIQTQFLLYLQLLLFLKFSVSIAQLLLYEDSSFRNMFNPWFVCIVSAHVGSYLLTKAIGSELYISVGYFICSSIILYILARRRRRKSKASTQSSDGMHEKLISEQEVNMHITVTDAHNSIQTNRQLLETESEERATE